MSHIEKPFGWRRNLDYIKANFNIMWKNLTEYKINLYSAFLEQIVYYIVYLFFYIALSQSFSSIINWKIEDFLLYATFLDLILVIAGIFYWSKDLRPDILSGKLNLTLIRPLNPQFAYQLLNLSSAPLIMILMNIIVLIGISIYYNITLISWVLPIMYLLLITFSYIMFKLFIKSINFYTFGITYIIDTIEYQTFFGLRLYPSPFFKHSIFEKIFLIYPIFFSGTLLLPTLKKYPIINLKLQILILISLTLFFTIASIINWHYGLKKYNAYG